MAEQEQTIPKSEVPQFPQPPEVGRRPRLYGYQWVGLPLIALVVILALLGVFGESFGETAEEGSALSMRIEYPTRFRYKEINPIHVWMTNRTTQALDTVTVAFDKSYLLEFSNVSFIPFEQEKKQINVCSDEMVE